MTHTHTHKLTVWYVPWHWSASYTIHTPTDWLTLYTVRTATSRRRGGGLRPLVSVFSPPSGPSPWRSPVCYVSVTTRRGNRGRHSALATRDDATESLRARGNPDKRKRVQGEPRGLPRNGHLHRQWFILISLKTLSFKNGEFKVRWVF